MDWTKRAAALFSLVFNHKERKVLQMIAEGRSTREISDHKQRNISCGGRAFDISQRITSVEEGGCGVRFIWLGGEAIPAINVAMKGMGFEIIDPGLSDVYVPGEEDLENCVALGAKIAANP